MLPNYLADIKSAGIYRFVWDRSEMPGQQAQILRLVIGYSEKGPFNTPVYVRNEQEFKQIFGGKSKKLERYGVWFHRMAVEALKGGPILALNIKNFENPYKEGTEAYKDFDEKYNRVDFTTFNPQESVFKVDSVQGTILDNLNMKVSELYNTDRFWKLEPEHLEDLVDEGVIEPEKAGYITITSTDSKDTSVSIFMRGYEPTGYDVTFKEWYSSVLNGEDLPAYMEGYENELVSHYFAQIYIFKGKFTPEIAASDKLSKFFEINQTDNGPIVSLKPYIENAFGEKIDTLEALANNDASNFVKSYSGILLPDFRNANNMVISLDSLVNGDNYTHKLLMRFNQAMLWEGDIKLDEIDTTGWKFDPQILPQTPMMSFGGCYPVIYEGSLELDTETGEYQWKYAVEDDEQDGLPADYYKYTGLEGVQGSTNYTLVFEDEDNAFGKSGIAEGDSIYLQGASNTLARVVKITQDSAVQSRDAWRVYAGNTMIDAGLDYDPSDDIEFVQGHPDQWAFENDVITNDTPEIRHYDAGYYITYEDPEDRGVIQAGIIAGPFRTNEATEEAIDQALVQGHEEVAEYWSCRYAGMSYTSNTEPELIQVNPGVYVVLFGTHRLDLDADYAECQDWIRRNVTHHETEPAVPDMWVFGDIIVYDEPYGYGSMGEEYIIWITPSDSGTSAEKSAPATKSAPLLPEPIPLGYSFFSEEDAREYVDEAFTPATTDSWTYNDATFETEVWAEIYQLTWNTYYVQFDKEVSSDSVIFKCVGSVTATSANLVPLYLEGYTFGNPKPDSTSQIDKLNWQHNILDSLTNYRGLRTALTNRVDIDYRYLVDTFESFVEPECKAVLANLCKEKDNVFGLLNFPKMSSFSKCKYTSFRNEKNEFLTKYIPMGGNPMKPMAKVFSLPSQENGASWIGFFSALALRDGDTGLREEIPSAALVSNDFMEKYTRYFPYTIIAGPNRSVIRETGLIGPDFNFSREDLNELEPFGVNCMVYEPRKGTYINANQTAKQNPVTALSRIHVRELVIYLQDEIEKLMTDYQWDFNTPNLQQRVKDRADVILEQVKNNDGLYAYVNVCDDSNNTDDVVNAEMFVLSTSIEPAQGAGKMVQELTIYRRGGMKSVITEA